ncbi:hypothetical protein VNO80_21186 [Phaseolus coccineus]|uniref:Uncharacterized protein n=1 Tax=Phaseolus coccineus TaxID=3886 RepID=A0AAN9M7A0_PHACN
MFLMQTLCHEEHFDVIVISSESVFLWSDRFGHIRDAGLSYVDKCAMKLGLAFDLDYFNFVNGHNLGAL